MYTAIYMPGNIDDAKSGFATEAEAWDYVFSRMCAGCQLDRKRALEGEEATEENDYGPSLYPACSAEWDVMLTEEYEKLKD